MSTSTFSTLRGEHILRALKALHMAEFLPYPPTPEQVGELRAAAFIASSSLRAYSGLNDVRVPISTEAA